MKINRALGFILFLFLANLVVGDVMRAFSQTLVATLGAVETAALTATVRLEEVR